MIARLSPPGSFLLGAINYNMTKVEEGEASVLSFNNFKTEEGTVLDVETAIPMMLCQSNLNERIEKPVFSCSLNLNYEDLDKMNALRAEKGEEAENEFYDEMARRYMAGMGYGNQPYLVFKHQDIERTHIHIVSIRVDENGDKINDSFEHARSERVRNEINESMGLSTKGEVKNRKLSDLQLMEMADKRNDYISRSASEVNSLGSRTGYDSDSDYEDLKKGANDAVLFHKVKNILKYVDENYHPKDLKEYNKILGQFNITCKKSEGEAANGKRFSGCQYATIDTDGTITSHLIKGAELGKRYALPGLEQRFALANNKKSIRELDDNSKKYIISNIENILNSPSKLSLDSLSDHLKDHGITLNLVKDNDDNSKIIGINFIDNLNGTTFNGNNLGKKFSYSNINKAIEKHNLLLENEAESAEESDNLSSYIPKEKFSEALKLINSTYNKIRKSDYKLESEAIKSIKNRQQEYEEIVKNSLLFNPLQAKNAVDFFRKNKETELEDIEFKENSYQKNQIIVAVQFAKHIQGEQEKAEFLEKFGVYSYRYNESLMFVSSLKQDVKLTFDEICEETKGSPDPVKTTDKLFNPHNIPEPSTNVTPITRTERQFVNAFIRQDKALIKGDMTDIVNLLGGDDKRRAADYIGFNKGELSEDLAIIRSIARTIQRDNYKYESDFIRNLEGHREQILNHLTDNGIDSLHAEAAFSNYVNYQEGRIAEVEGKELDLAMSRFVTASLFAQKISTPEDRVVFFNRMGIDVKLENNQLYLCRNDKDSLKSSWNDLLSRDSRLQDGKPLFDRVVPSVSLEDVKPFNKKERDFVSIYVSGNLSQESVDARYASAAKYLDKESKADVTRFGTASRVHDILERNKTASIDATVKALLYRGLIIKPVKENGNTVFRVGMHNTGDETYVALPYNIQERLKHSNFERVYPSLEKLILNGRFNTPKMSVLKDITRAADYMDPSLLEKAIERVQTRNEHLADAMRKAAGSMVRPDYERVANLVANYQGEKKIILPPSTPKSESFVKNRKEKAEKERSAENVSEKEYRAMLEALNNGTALEYIFKLGKDLGNTNNKI